MRNIHTLRERTLDKPANRITLEVGDSDISIHDDPRDGPREQVTLTRTEALRMADIILKAFLLDAIGQV